ncbi:MAG: tRNA uridine-5-carboxymethylaminomethyl(34) synthesis GTPase MnmE, partial [bacterium]
MTIQKDAIAAISTPIGSGGIAVIRVSGSTAIEIVDKVFRGSVRLIAADSHKVYWGKIIMPNGIPPDKGSTNRVDQNSNLLDEVVVTVFRAPQSYTRENVVEISCHGGAFLTKTILELLLKQGARLAEPGEFTLRAFLNGRFDLAQAEAVADMIRAKTDLSLKAALSQFQGTFSQRIKQIRQKLIDVCSLLELELDFAEEDVEFAEKREVKNRLNAIINEVEDFANSYKKGKILREGAKLVIIGKPNVGKSSLLNALLKEERAIVTEVPGTTRDTLEEQLNIAGVLFRVVDTAGVRDTQEVVEREGVSRTLMQIKEADIILFLFDASNILEPYDKELINQVLSLRGKAVNSMNGIVAVINKIDLEKKISNHDLLKKLGRCPILEISAKYHLGLKGLEDALIEASLGKMNIARNEPVVTNIRQKQAFDRALGSLKLVLKSLEKGLSSEFIALDL